MHTPRHRARALAGLALGFALTSAGCGGPLGPDDMREAAGIYLLETVDGDSLPLAVASFLADSVQVIVEIGAQGVWELKPDRTFTAQLVDQRLVFNAFTLVLIEERLVPREIDEGAWSIRDADVQLRYSDGRLETGTLEGDVLELRRGASIWRLRR